MGKKLMALLLCVCLMASFTLTGCGSKSADGQEVKVIRVAFNQNENHPQYKAMKELGEKFEKATNGRYKMTIYANGVLGEQGSMAEFIRTGALDMAIVPCSVPEGYDSNFAIVGAPYLYQDMDHLRRATESGVFTDLSSQQESTILKSLQYIQQVKEIYMLTSLSTQQMILRV